MGRLYPRILIIDDSAAFREFARYSIKADLKFVHIIESKNAMDGMKMYRQYKPDVVLLDWQMPEINGLTVLEAIMNLDKSTRVIMTTAYTEDQFLLDDMMKMGAFSFVSKPMNRINLLKVVSDALRVRKNAGHFGTVLTSGAIEPK